MLRWADRYTLWAFNPPQAVTRGGRSAARPCTRSEPESRSGPSTAELVAQLVAREMERANARQDPVRTLGEVDLLAAHLLASVADLRSVLPPALRTLRRRGWSFEQIAAHSGLTMSRVIELARESRARRL